MSLGQMDGAMGFLQKKSTLSVPASAAQEAHGEWDVSGRMGSVSGVLCVDPEAP